MSVRRRLLIGLIALVLAVDGLAGFLSYRSALQSTGTLLDDQLRQMAVSLRDQGAALPDFAFPVEASDFDFLIQIWNRDGASIYASPNELPLSHTAPLGFTDLTVNGERWRAFAMQTPKRVILVAQPNGKREALAATLALRTLAPLLLLTPLLALAIWIMVVRTLAPIRRVVGEVQHRHADSLQPLQTRDLPQEIEPLVAEFNRLLARLDAAFVAQRALVSDAAHELRSPLTALRLQLQLLRRAATESEHAEADRQLTQAMDRAGSLVNQLLILARNDRGAAALPQTVVPFADVVRAAVADCAGLALARGIDLGLEEGPVAGADVIGDRESLHNLVRNLVDNAVRYTPGGGSVQVSLRRDDGGLSLSVDDSGPGIAASERARVYDRFYRGADVVEAGNGLGLAIVKAIVERHQGQIGMATSVLGGLQVTLHLRSVAEGGHFSVR